MRIKFFSFCILVGMSCVAFATYDISKRNLQTQVSFLTSESLAGRLTGSPGEQLASEYIAAIFKDLGLEPAGDHGTFFQEFSFNSALTPKINKGRNVLAKLRVGQKPLSMIVIGAHLDHLGRGEIRGSLARDDERDRIHPGADDNASGVASMLAVAAKLSHLKAQGKLRGNKDILFAAWSGEEFGILGSSHFASRLMSSSEEKSLQSMVEAAINLDMVGHLRKNLVIQGIDSSSEWINILNNMKTHHGLNLMLQRDPYLPTDSTAFYIRGVPTLNFFTGAHEAYHSPRDTADTLNYEGIKSISEFLVDLILSIEQRSQLITYQNVQPSHADTKRDYKIYLGTIPDYAGADISGVKLSGVAKGSPAEHAGIKQHDVVIELAGKNVRDIYDYTKILNSLKVDVPVTLWVLRKTQRIKLIIVPGHRV